MTTGTSPFIWNGDTLKIKTVLDRYIESIPSCTELPVTTGAYGLLLKSISASTRKLHESNLRYRGRRIIVNQRGR